MAKSSSYNYIDSLRSPWLRLEAPRFDIVIRQQPRQARVRTPRERDRRPIEPPPILQLKFDESSTEETQHCLQNPHFFVLTALVPADDRYAGRAFFPRQQLKGSVVSTLHKLKDIGNADGGFFVFPDLTISLEGKYRLKFNLYCVTSNEAVYLKTVHSDPFIVYNSKEYPGMCEPTFLTRAFSDQGLKLRIRKEHRIRAAKRASISLEETAEDPERGPAQGTKRKFSSEMDIIMEHTEKRGHAQPSMCAPMSPQHALKYRYNTGFKAWREEYPSPHTPEPYSSLHAPVADAPAAQRRQSASTPGSLTHSPAPRSPLFYSSPPSKMTHANGTHVFNRRCNSGELASIPRHPSISCGQEPHPSCHPLQHSAVGCSYSQPPLTAPLLSRRESYSCGHLQAGIGGSYDRSPGGADSAAAASRGIRRSSSMDPPAASHSHPLSLVHPPDRSSRHSITLPPLQFPQPSFVNTKSHLVLPPPSLLFPPTPIHDKAMHRYPPLAPFPASSSPSSSPAFGVEGEREALWGEPFSR
ncbi:uncharacterized protein VTP21DRAFT_3388 [Calcarisporiella thermophila]|uniref:uncharacterized protein n=1 Tax=Calcarisporiella thermophila TaxID=911321 RepID=UPI003744AE88